MEGLIFGILRYSIYKNGEIVLCKTEETDRRRASVLKKLLQPKIVEG